MRQLELRRHAHRDPTEDRLSPEGRAQAGAVGRTLVGGYAAVFVSPARRTAETMALFLQALGERRPVPGVVPGLTGVGVEGHTPEGLAEVVRGLLEQVPEGGRGLAVGHTPLIERAVLGLTGRQIEPLGECEGVLLTEDGGEIGVEELR